MHALKKSIICLLIHPLSQNTFCRRGTAPILGLYLVVGWKRYVVQSADEKGSKKYMPSDPMPCSQSLDLKITPPPQKALLSISQNSCSSWKNIAKLIIVP